MAKLESKKLEQLNKEELLNIINDVAVNISDVATYINVNYLTSSDKKAKELLATYKKFRRSTRFHDYYDTIEFVNQMQEKVLTPAKKSCKDTPKEIADLAQLILDDFEKIFAHKDDSSGCGYDLLNMSCELWGEAWKYITPKKPYELAGLVVKYYKDQGYLGLEIFDYFKVALGIDGLVFTETLLDDNVGTLFYVVHLQNDVDKLITLINTRKLFAAEYVFKLVTLLLDDLRSAEAIDWIIKYVPENIANEHHYLERQDLLIRAFGDEGDKDSLMQTLWNTFAKTLSAEYYKSLMGAIDIAQQDDYKAKSLAIITKSNNIGSACIFLDEVQEYEELNKLLLENLDKISIFNVSFIRKLSKTLATHGYFLVATLIRRALINQVLVKAQSKYYHYAVSDLKLSIEYGSQIVDWQGFKTNNEYITELKNTHPRKLAFWSQINFVD